MRRTSFRSSHGDLFVTPRPRPSPKQQIHGVRRPMSSSPSKPRSRSLLRSRSPRSSLLANKKSMSPLARARARARAHRWTNHSTPSSSSPSSSAVGRGDDDGVVAGCGFGPYRWRQCGAVDVAVLAAAVTGRGASHRCCSPPAAPHYSPSSPRWRISGGSERQHAPSEERKECAFRDRSAPLQTTGVAPSSSQLRGAGGGQNSAPAPAPALAPALALALARPALARSDSLRGLPCRCHSTDGGGGDRGVRPCRTSRPCTPGRADENDEDAQTLRPRSPVPDAQSSSASSPT